ncbi:MAG: transaldolase, partial [Sedimenticolaceae bacterium]
KTLLAFAEHGQIHSALPTDGGDAEAMLAELAQTGVDDGALAAQLQREGVQSFAGSWNALIERMASKSAALTQSQTGGAAP